MLGVFPEGTVTAPPAGAQNLPFLLEDFRVLFFQIDDFAIVAGTTLEQRAAHEFLASRPGRKLDVPDAGDAIEERDAVDVFSSFGRHVGNDAGARLAGVL